MDRHHFIRHYHLFLFKTFSSHLHYFVPSLCHFERIWCLLLLAVVPRAIQLRVDGMYIHKGIFSFIQYFFWCTARYVALFIIIQQCLSFVSLACRLLKTDSDILRYLNGTVWALYMLYKMECWERQTMCLLLVKCFAVCVNCEEYQSSWFSSY